MTAAIKPFTAADVECFRASDRESVSDSAIDRTHVAAVRRFAAEHNDRFLRDHRLGKWRQYDAPCWRLDDTGAALMALQEQQERHVASIVSDRRTARADRDAALKAAVGLLNARTLPALLALAAVQPDLARAGDEFDRDPWLLAVQNGVIDLANGGHFRAGSPADHLSLQSGATFDADAPCPRFLAFLDQIFEGNVRLAAFIQRVAGYGLTGSVREQVFFGFHGTTGANGKTVLANVLSHLMGTYALTLPFATFTAAGQRGSSATPDLAALPGRRLVMASEARITAKFDEAKLKQLTGGDRVSARHLHAEFFEFTPVCKLIFLFNDAPRVTDNGSAFWRRVVLIPFNRRFSEHEQDRSLEAKLLTELAGILNWAIAGCLAWQRDGLAPPAEVSAAVEEWRAESDIVAEFVTSGCDAAPGVWVHAREMHAAFGRWCERERIEERDRIGRRTMSSRLSTMLQPERNAAGERGFVGMRPKDMA